MVNTNSQNYSGPRTTADSAEEGRLKVDASRIKIKKRKIIKKYLKSGKNMNKNIEDNDKINLAITEALVKEKRKKDADGDKKIDLIDITKKLSEKKFGKKKR